LATIIIRWYSALQQLSLLFSETKPAHSLVSQTKTAHSLPPPTPACPSFSHPPMGSSALNLQKRIPADYGLDGHGALWKERAEQVKFF